MELESIMGTQTRSFLSLHGQLCFWARVILTAFVPMYIDYSYEFRITRRWSSGGPGWMGPSFTSYHITLNINSLVLR
jgi:hypothetical protein